MALAGAMWPAAAGIALMSFTESIAAARAFGASGEPRPEPNQELFALGVANVAGGLFGAMPAGGGTSQTAVNHLAGARSQVATLVTAATALFILLLLGPVIALDAAGGPRGRSRVLLARPDRASRVRRHPPRASHRVSLGSRRVCRRRAAGYARGHPGGGDPVTGVARAAGLQPPGSRPGPQAGHDGLSRAYAQSTPTTRRGRACSSFVSRGGSSSPMPNASSIGSAPLLDQEQPRVLLLDCRAIIDIEYTALRMLIDAEERLRAEGTSLWLAGISPNVLEVVRRQRPRRAPRTRAHVLEPRRCRARVRAAACRLSAHFVHQRTRA